MKKMVPFLLTSFLVADTQLDILKKELQMQRLKMAELEAKIEALSTVKKRSASFSQKAFLPDIALIFNMSAVGRDVKNSKYENYAIPGFIDRGDAELPFNKNRGFNFNYAEVAMNSTVDPYFDAFAIFHLHPDAFEIEEAFVRTRALPYGLRIKAGKFRSAFGRLNAKHQHSWNFDQQALIYKALLGPEGISDPGIQLQWVAPTDSYLMVGVEAMQGNNEESFGDGGGNLLVGYIKSGFDLSEDTTLLAGMSLAHGKNEDKKYTNLYGAELTLRKDFGAYRNIIWQSEYLYRDKDKEDRTDKQAGFYTQLVYQYNKNCRGGIRYDRITKNDTDLSAYQGIDTDDLDRWTAMIEYKPFPMSRLRLSYSYDRSKIIGGERKDINEVIFSLNIATGAHPAHSF